MPVEPEEKVERPEDSAPEDSGFMQKEPEGDTIVDVDDPPETAPGRDEKKAQRGKRLVEESKAEADRYRQDAEQTRRENQELRERMARVEGRMETQAPAKDPVDAKLQKNWDDRQALFKSLNRAGVTQEEIDAGVKKARELEDEAVNIKVDQGVKRGLQEHQRNQPNPRAQYMMQQYRDVIENDRARNYYMQRYYARKAELNLPPNQQVPENVLIEALEFGRKMAAGGTAPTSTEKSRFTGSPVGGADSGKTYDSKVNMGARQNTFADAAFKSVKDPAERQRLWSEKLVKIRKANAR